MKEILCVNVEGGVQFLEIPTRPGKIFTQKRITLPLSPLVEDMIEVLEYRHSPQTPPILKHIEKQKMVFHIAYCPPVVTLRIDSTPWLIRKVLKLSQALDDRLQGLGH